MQFLLMIWRDHEVPHEVPDGTDVLDAYRHYTEALKAAGRFVAGDALHAPSEASTVRSRGGRVLCTDGPFTETKEQLAGYYLIEADDRAEAERWAAKCPGATAGGAIEVRPVWIY